MSTKNGSVSVKEERLRYSGDCVCWLPIVDPDQIPTSNAEGKEIIFFRRGLFMFFLLYTVNKSECKKCGKDSWILRDSVEFGNSVEEVVRELRFKIEQKTGLTASAGK